MSNQAEQRVLGDSIGSYKILRFPYEGAIDADGHIMEPSKLWEDYLEDKYKDRAIRFRRDRDNLEYIEIDGQPHPTMARGLTGINNIAADRTQLVFTPDTTWESTKAFGAGDMHERMELLDRENLERAVLYPSVGLMWQSEIRDAELAVAYCRAYNRWIVDFCANSGGRLIPVALIFPMDPEATAAELKRAVKAGCKAGITTPNLPPMSGSQARRPMGHPAHDPVFAMAQELDVPLGIHVGGPTPEDIDWYATFDERTGTIIPQSRAYDSNSPAAWNFELNVMGFVYHAQKAFLSFFTHGTFERFPKLTLGVLEAGAGWIGVFLERMDEVWENVGPVPGWGIPLKEKPSFYFKRQCYISGEPEEVAAMLIMDYVGHDKFMWASDFPHYDHPESWVSGLTKTAQRLNAPQRAALLGANAKRFYRL